MHAALLRLLLLAAALSFLPTSVCAQSRPAAELATIYAPKAGRFGVEVPSAWRRVIRPREQADSLTLEPDSGKAALVLFFYPQPKDGLPNDEALEKMARQLCQPFLSDMVEQTPVFTALESKNGKAIQTTLTDKKLVGVAKPKKGDYRLLTHGLLVLEDRMVMFGVLHNDSNGAELKQALQIVAEGVSRK